MKFYQAIVLGTNVPQHHVVFNNDVTPRPGDIVETQHGTFTIVGMFTRSTKEHSMTYLVCAVPVLPGETISVDGQYTEQDVREVLNREYEGLLTESRSATTTTEMVRFQHWMSEIKALHHGLSEHLENIRHKTGHLKAI